MAENLDIIVAVVDKATAPIRKISDSMRANFDEATKVSKRLALGIGAIGAAAGLFSAKAVSDFSSVGDAVEKMAKRTGLSAEAVSALRVAADGAGTSIESVEIGVKMMQKTLTDASSASDGLKDAMKGIDMSVDDLFAKGVTPEIQFELLAAAIGSIEDPSKRTQVAMDAFGKAGSDLIPLFEDGQFSMEQWSQKAKDLGVSFDDLSASKAAALNDALGEASTIIKSISLEIGSRLAPYVTKAANAFQEWYKSVGGIDGILNSISDALERYEPMIYLVSGALVGAMIPAFIAFATTLWTTVIPALIGTLVAMAPYILIGAAVGLAIYGIVKAFQALKERMPEIMAKWEELKTKFLEVAGAVLEGITSAFNKVVDFFRAFFGILKDIFFFNLAFVTGLVITVFEAMGIDLFAVWEGIKVMASALWEFISGLFTTKMEETATKWTERWNFIKNIAGIVWEGIKTGAKAFFDALVAIVTGYIEFIVAPWKALWTGITNIVENNIENVKGTVKAGLNWIIEKINAFISAANAIARKGNIIPGIKIPEIPSIPRLAQGGIVTRPTLAMIGEGGESEAVVPLSKAGSMGFGGGITININNAQILSDEDIVEKIGDPIMRVLQQHMAVAGT